MTLQTFVNENVKGFIGPFISVRGKYAWQRVFQVPASMCEVSPDRKSMPEMFDKRQSTASVMIGSLEAKFREVGTEVISISFWKDFSWKSKGKEVVSVDHHNLLSMGMNEPCRNIGNCCMCLQKINDQLSSMPFAKEAIVWWNFALSVFSLPGQSNADYPKSIFWQKV